jgi:nucleoside-diphosphate kinase
VSDTERSFVMVKPDAVARGLTGEILARIERRGLNIVGLKRVRMDRATAEEHYGEHRERPFFGELVDFITSGPVVMSCVEGPGAIAVLRTMMGATNPTDAAPGTIRGDFALEVGENCVHGSDSPDSAARELALHFGPTELV